jgi:hypothetical protein
VLPQVLRDFFAVPLEAHRADAWKHRAERRRPRVAFEPLLRPATYMSHT